MLMWKAKIICGNCEECEFKEAIQGFSPEKQISWGELWDCFLNMVCFFLIGISWVLGREKGRIIRCSKWAASRLCLPLESMSRWDLVCMELLQRKASPLGSGASPSPLHFVSSVNGFLELLICLGAFSNTSFTVRSYRALFLRICEDCSAPSRIWAVIKTDTDWHIVKLYMYHLLLDNTGHPLVSLG